MALDTNSEPGDTTRRNGDYISLPDPDVEEDGTNAIGEGVPVTFDGDAISAAAVDGSGTGDPIVGVVYTYQYFGDSSRDGPYIDTDRDPTIKTSGTVVADLSDIGATPSVGDVLGPNGEMLVLQESNSGTDHYEVLLR